MRELIALRLLEVYFRLVSEVKQLQATLANLRQRLDEEQQQLQKLVTTRSNLEHEIRTKVIQVAFIKKPSNVTFLGQLDLHRSRQMHVDAKDFPNHAKIGWLFLLNSILYRGPKIYLYRNPKYIFL